MIRNTNKNWGSFLFLSLLDIHVPDTIQSGIASSDKRVIVTADDTGLAIETFDFLNISLRYYRPTRDKLLLKTGITDQTKVHNESPKRQIIHQMKTQCRVQLPSVMRLSSRTTFYEIISEKLYVYGAYIDERPNGACLRILAVGRLDVTPDFLWCQLWEYGSDLPDYSKATREVVPETHNNAWVNLHIVLFQWVFQFFLIWCFNTLRPRQFFLFGSKFLQVCS